MDDEPWQRRAKNAGLSQKELARLMGVTENSMSLQLRGKWPSGTPPYVVSFILAWERLSQKDRDGLRSDAVEFARRERTKPKTPDGSEG